MSEHQTPRSAVRIASLILPCASLALTLSAFCLGAPAKLARLAHGPMPVLSSLEFDATIRYEPVVAADLSDYRLVGARRVLDHLVSGQLIAFK